MRKFIIKEGISLIVSDETGRKIDNCRRIVRNFAESLMKNDYNSIDSWLDDLYTIESYEEEVWAKIGYKPF